jgi:glycosyltransferase involved in cell wall biosynthesis
MILSFVYPSSRERAGGVAMLYEFANVMARRGHEVHFIHGPRTRFRVDTVDEIPYPLDDALVHHVVDTLEDPGLPVADVAFERGRFPALGNPATFIQGFRLIGDDWDRAAFRARCPKVCIATWLLDVGRAYGAPAEQLVHVPMGLDHDVFACRRRRGDRTYDVAMLHHPMHEKGWDIGRAVLLDLAARRPGFRAVVFAMEEPPPEPLPPGVDVRIDMDQRELADAIYNDARVFVQASRHEGFGLTALEAMACGATLVTTDCGGSRDYAVADRTAVVVPPGDRARLAAATGRMLDEPATADRIAAEGVGSVRRFDWNHSGELLERFLVEYVADPERMQRAPGDDHSAEYSL